MRIPRKLEHVHYALQLGQEGSHGFSDIKLIHNCIPESSTKLISLQTTIGELNLSSPIIINAMTGGAWETEEINRELAVAARETGLAMAVGSQMSAIKNSDVVSSYKVVRQMNPDGIVIGNLGSEATPEQAEQAVEMIRADALQIHLNVMQELIMPEGDRDFRGMRERIAAIIERINVPVIVKEVGFGMVRESVAALCELGVPILDVGGSGGTNFAAIENARRDESIPWLNEWGSTTAVSLLESLHALNCRPAGGNISIIASGGISGSRETVKALVLGASAVGVAGAFLKTLRTEDTSALIAQINRMHEELTLVMTALGTPAIADLRHVPAVITGETAHWCFARGMDIRPYAQRPGFNKNKINQPY